MIENCQLIELPSMKDSRGNLSFVESNKHIKFAIERIYYLYGVPSGADRGGHAHKSLHQLFIPISGSFDIHLDDGNAKKTIHMSQADKGLYVCQMIWRQIDNFSTDAVCLVLASHIYDEGDYYRDYSEFLKNVRA